MAAQAALARVLAGRVRRPDRGAVEQPLGFRVVAARGSLVEAQDRLLPDLLVRLDVLRLAVPPLRDRAEDVAPRATERMQTRAAMLGRAPVPLDAAALPKPGRHDWPGNMAEPCAFVDRAPVAGALPEHLSGDGTGDGPVAVESLDEAMKRHVMHVLGLCGGNRAEAARRLGVSRKTVDRKLQVRAEPETAHP